MIRRNTLGHTLIELLVVVALIGMLFGFLLPALQAARECARRSQCTNNLHQLGIALHDYHDTLRTFPSGIVEPSFVFWSGSLLPFLEQSVIFDTLDFSKPWEKPGSTNAIACKTYLPVFRCPSSDAPAHVDIQGIDDRVPTSYLAVGSGTAKRESGFAADHLGLKKQDGLLYLGSAKKMASVTDGTSNCLAIGEALFRPDTRGPDLDNVVQIIDHWYIGSDGLGRAPGNPSLVEVSEALGSSGVRMNAWKLDVFIDEKEIGFTSLHWGGCSFVFADAHVQFVSEGTDRLIYSGLGTIAGHEVVAYEH